MKRYESTEKPLIHDWTLRKYTDAEINLFIEMFQTLGMRIDELIEENVITTRIKHPHDITTSFVYLEGDPYFEIKVFDYFDPRDYTCIHDIPFRKILRNHKHYVERCILKDAIDTKRAEIQAQKEKELKAFAKAKQKEIADRKRMERDRSEYERLKKIFEK